MIGMQQLIKHDPENDKYGDCFRTCIAIILDEDPEVVPHFCDPNQFDDRKKVLRKFLHARDLDVQTTMYPGEISFEDVLFTTGHYNPDIPMIVTGKSKRGVNHCVVIMNGEVFCDPFDGTDRPDPFISCAEPTGMWWVETIAMKANH